MAIAIAARNLTRKFGDVTAIDSLSIQIESQKIHGFLGPNGCGKTTLIRMLTGLLRPSAGEVEILGQPLSTMVESLRGQMGYMTQKFSLYDDLTVLENLKFMASVYGLKAKAQKARIHELLSVYELGSLERQLAGSMSGGQKQRLALACATLHQPKLLFLDEPTSAVDPQNRRDFWEKLFALCDLGTTILVSTHYMDEAERCHHLAILQNGIKRADDTPDNLMRDMPAHVIELSGDQLSTYKQRLSEIPSVVSAAQLGLHLRVLVKKDEADPIAYLRAGGIDCPMQAVRPSLEDVFVMSTEGHP